MFQLLNDRTGGTAKWGSNLLEDMHYEICLSYIRHASRTLALRESELMHQSALFLTTLATSHDKSITEPSSTEASFENRRLRPELSPRAAERKAFMRRSKRGGERPTLRSRQQALQQVKQVCSEPTIAVIEALMGEYRKLMQDLTKNDFQEAFSRKKCENCIAIPLQDQSNTRLYRQLEERLKKVSGELRITVGKNEQLAKQLSGKLCELQKYKAQLQPQQRLNAFLREKQERFGMQLQEVKVIEREILLRLDGMDGEKGGCERCRCVRAIKGQLLQFRRYLERQGEQLEALYIRLKRSLITRTPS